MEKLGLRLCFVLSSSFSLLELAGIYSDKRKWAHFFENEVTTIIYCVDMSIYDQWTTETPSSNRMLETISLWESTCKHPWFCRTPIVLLLNKIDLFAVKLQSAPLSSCFPDYYESTCGANELQSAAQFLKEKFLSIVQSPSSPSRPIFCYFTCAIETTNLKSTFDHVFNTLFS